MKTLTQVQARQAQGLFREEVLSGLKASPKRLPCKHFYDERGSALFDQICELDEYYLTRSELEIMQEHAAEMGAQIGPGVRLVEYGSGSSMKTRILLDYLPAPRAYVPVDISRDYLIGTAKQLQQDYPQIEVLPVVADFTKPFELPEPRNSPSHTAIYFPGSTIGNLEEPQAAELLQTMASQCGPGGGLLIGVDLEKDPHILQLAYDDPAGVTAEFNLNLLHRIRNELTAELDISNFEHLALYNQRRSRVEIYIRSQQQQTITIDGERIFFEEGELIHTEYSHKYTIDRFAALASEAGFFLHKSWTDARGYFAVLHLVVDENSIPGPGISGFRA